MIFSHSGAIGDIVYHLPVIRYLGGGDFAFLPMDVGRTYELALRRLVEAQPYIGRVEWSDNQVGLCFNGWRKHVDFSRNLTNQVTNWLDLPPIPDDCPPWLTVEPWPQTQVVIARATRNLNPGFPWRRVLDRFAGRCGFVGHKHEHDAFCIEYGPIPHLPTTDMLDVARVIAGANLFVGSTSGPLAVAEGLKQNVIVSSTPGISHCCYYNRNRPGLQHCWDVVHLDIYDDDGRCV